MFVVATTTTTTTTTTTHQYIGQSSDNDPWLVEKRLCGSGGGDNNLPLGPRFMGDNRRRRCRGCSWFTSSFNHLSYCCCVNCEIIGCSHMWQLVAWEYASCSSGVRAFMGLCPSSAQIHSIRSLMWIKVLNSCKPTITTTTITTTTKKRTTCTCIYTTVSEWFFEIVLKMR